MSQHWHADKNPKLHGETSSKLNMATLYMNMYEHVHVNMTLTPSRSPKFTNQKTRNLKDHKPAIATGNHFSLN